MLKRLIEWFKSLLKKVSAPASSADSPRTNPAPPSVKVFDLQTKEGWEAYRASFVPTTQAYIPTWDQKARIDSLIAAAAGSVDRSGFDLGEGEVKVNDLVNGQLYTYTYKLRPGITSAEIYVFGAEGSEVHEVNGQSVLPEKRAVLKVQPSSGSIVLTVKSVGGRVAVQVRQS